MSRKALHLIKTPAPAGEDRRPLPARILDTDLPPMAKLVGLVLAQHANAEGKCWPALPTIAKKSGLTVRGVQKNLRKLEEAGVISTSSRETQKGSNGANLYVFQGRTWFTRGCEPGSPPPRTTFTTPPNDVHHLGTKEQELSNEPLLRNFVPDANQGSRGQEGPSVREIDQGPEATNFFAQQTVAPKGKGPRESRPIETWTNIDVARDFADQAARFFPMRSNRCNPVALAGGLKRDREKTGHGPELHVAMTDAFFSDMYRDLIHDKAPLWQQFLAKLAFLTERAEETLDWTRKRRQGHGKYDPQETAPATEDEKARRIHELYGTEDLDWSDWDD